MPGSQEANWQVQPRRREILDAYVVVESELDEAKKTAEPTPKKENEKKAA